MLAHTSLSGVVGAFSTAHREVRLEMVAEDRLVDPVSDGYDVIVRVNLAPAGDRGARLIVAHGA